MMGPLPKGYCLRCLQFDCEHMAPPPPHLTRCELDVIRLLGVGLSNKQIAARLGLRTGTIKGYISRSGGIFCKTHTENRVQLALWARDHANAVQPIQEAR
jgi:DNA-binding NarL/FixJ family response regulator